MPRALVVEDDENVLYAVADLAEKRGFTTDTANSVASARTSLRQVQPDLALIDVVLPGGSGFDLLMELSGRDGPHVILMSGDETIGLALKDLNFQSLNYLQKPIDTARLRSLLDTAYRSRREMEKARKSKFDEKFGNMVGESDPMRRLCEMIEKVAPTDATVLVSGESGTGKELIAQAIHRLSPRKKGPFVALNCGAIPDTLIDSELFGHAKGAFTGATESRRGVFEEANGGTLFLDEIAEMPMELQVRLLRVLENGKVRRVGGNEEVRVDVRVIAATNRMPAAAVEEGRLREDLMYRLAVFPIRVAPLRSRGTDVEHLAEYFLDELNRHHAQSKRFGGRSLELIRSYHWPGNVRQLRHSVQSAFIMAEQEIHPEHLPGQLRNQVVPGQARIELNVGTSIAQAERHLIFATLDHYDGDKKKAADVLGMSLRTLYNRLNSYREESDRMEERSAGQ